MGNWRVDLDTQYGKSWVHVQTFDEAIHVAARWSDRLTYAVNRSS